MTHDDFNRLSYHEKEAIRHNRGVSIVLLADGTYIVFAHGRPTDSATFVTDPLYLATAVHKVYNWMEAKAKEPQADFDRRAVSSQPSHRSPRGSVVEIEI